MEVPPTDSRSYWRRVSARAAREAFHEVFHSRGRLIVDVTSRGIAAIGLALIGLSEVAKSHSLWEIACFIVLSGGIFLPVFLWKLFATPAKMDRERLDRESKMQQTIAALQPRESAVEFAQRKIFKEKYDALGADEKIILRKLVIGEDVKFFGYSSALTPAMKNLLTIQWMCEHPNMRWSLCSEVSGRIKYIINEELESENGPSNRIK